MEMPPRSQAETKDETHETSIDLGCFDSLFCDPDATTFTPPSFVNQRQVNQSSALSISLPDSDSFFEPSSVALSTHSILCDSPASEDLDFTGIYYVENQTPVEKKSVTMSSETKNRRMSLHELLQLRECLLKSLVNVAGSCPSDGSSVGMSLGDYPVEQDEDVSFVAQLPQPSALATACHSTTSQFLNRESSASSDLSSTHTLPGEVASVMPLAMTTAASQPMPMPRESVAVLIDAVRASTLADADRCRFVFDLFDVDKRGVISRDAVTAFVEATLLVSNLKSVRTRQVQETVNRLFQHSSSYDQMTYCEFQNAFVRTIRVHDSASKDSRDVDIEGTQTTVDETARSSEYKPSIHYRHSHVAEKKENFWHRVVLRLYFKYDTEVRWLAFYFTVLLVAFVLKVVCVDWDPVAGYAPHIATGSAQVILVNVCILLVSLSRSVVTYLRRFRSMTSRVPIDKYLGFLKICGGTMMLASVGHVFAWVVIFVRLRTASDELWRQSRFNRLAFVREDTVTELLERVSLWTGSAMVGVAIIAAPMMHAKARGVNFNAFLIPHLVILLFVLLLLVHGAAMWVQPPHAFVWVLPPLVLYAIERRYRVTSLFGVPATIVRVQFSQDTVTIFITKPRDFRFQPGMSVYLNVPVISRFEWRRFTITSAPEDDFLSVHIRDSSNSTSALYHSVKTTLDRRPEDAAPEHLSPYPSVFLDGPVGAPSQEYHQYKSAVFVCAGVGVTQFASILRSIVHQWASFQCPCCNHVNFPPEFQLQKIHFYWLTYEDESLGWFAEMMDQLAAMNTGNRLEFRKYRSPGTRASVGGPQQALQTVAHDIGVHETTTLCTHGGRPDWTTEFNRIAQDNLERRVRDDDEAVEVDDVGVFFCGPQPIGRAIQDACAIFNQRKRPTGVSFDFYSEMLQ